MRKIIISITIIALILSVAGTGVLVIIESNQTTESPVTVPGE